jgi:hypothetical protein
MRTLINQIEVTCKLCKEKYLLLEEQNHYKLKCPYFNLIKCRYCPQEVPKDQIVKHTRLEHEDKLDTIIEEIYANPAPLLDPKKVLKEREHYLAQIGRSPQLGSSGKFYCGSKLDGPKCGCCNGYCGPTNGCNCSECMKLDVMRLGLPRGYLLNTDGKVCWKEGNHFVCNSLTYYPGNRCNEGNWCNSCQNMLSVQARYEDLL